MENKVSIDKENEFDPLKLTLERIESIQNEEKASQKSEIKIENLNNDALAFLEKIQQPETTDNSQTDHFSELESTQEIDSGEEGEKDEKISTQEEEQKEENENSRESEEHIDDNTMQNDDNDIGENSTDNGLDAKEESGTSLEENEIGIEEEKEKENETEKIPSEEEIRKRMDENFKDEPEYGYVEEEQKDINNLSEESTSGSIDIGEPNEDESDDSDNDSPFEEDSIEDLFDDDGELEDDFEDDFDEEDKIEERYENPSSDSIDVGEPNDDEPHVPVDEKSQEDSMDIGELEEDEIEDLLDVGEPNEDEIEDDRTELDKEIEKNLGIENDDIPPIPVEIATDTSKEDDEVALDFDANKQIKDDFGGIFITSDQNKYLAPYFSAAIKKDDDEWSYLNSVKVNENDVVTEAVCPICGTLVKKKYDNMQIIEDEWTNHPIKFKHKSGELFIDYIDCDSCKKEILDYYNNHKKLCNLHLKQNIMRITPLLGLSFNYNKTKELYKSDILFPNDKFICEDNDGQLYSFTFLTLTKAYAKAVNNYMNSTALDLLPVQDYQDFEDLCFKLLDTHEGKIANEFKKFAYKDQVETISSTFSVLIDQDKEFEEGRQNYITCLHDCKTCPREFYVTTLNELIEYSAGMNGNIDNCTLFQYISKDGSDQLSAENLPPLTERQIETIKKYRPSKEVIRPYLESYTSNSRYEKVNREYLEELAIRDWIEYIIKKEDANEKARALDENLFGMADDGEETYRMSGDSSSRRDGIDPRNDNRSAWKQTEHGRWFEEEDRARRERMEEGRIYGDEMLKGVIGEDDKIDPALQDATLKEKFRKTPFWEMIKMIMADKKNNTTTIQVQNSINTNYVPIIDTSTGYRFVCVETDDELKSYLFDIIKLSANVPFWFKEHTNSFITYPLYKNNVKGKTKQNAMAITKLINYDTSYDKRRICRLNDDYIPVYITDKHWCDRFFSMHSLNVFDRFHVEQLVIIGSVKNEDYKDSDENKRRKIYKEQIQRFSRNKDTNREGADLVGLAGIKYYSASRTDYSGKVVGKRYTITQYTENTNLMLENGFWFAVLALMKEHEKIYNENRTTDQRIYMEIRFELDRTAPPSPIITNMVRQDGCLKENTRNYIGADFEVSYDYRSMPIQEQVWAGLIPDPANRKPGVARDWGIIDERYFMTEALIRKTWADYLKNDAGNIELSTESDRLMFLKSRGCDIEFTTPKPILLEIRGETLQDLINSAAYKSLKMINIANYSQDEMDEIIGTHNAEVVHSVLGPVWEKFASNAPTPILKDIMNNIGKNISGETVKAIMSFFKN